MPKHLAVLAIAAACATPKAIAPPVVLAPQVEWDDPSRLEKLAAAAASMVPALDERLAELNVPGAALGLVAGGRLIWFHAAGVREVKGAPVDQDTVFRIASMSKAFVSAAVLRLRDEGRLSLDDPAERYLPELRALVYPTRDSPRVTVRQLLSHSAGLPEDNASADLRMPMPDAEFDTLLARGLSFSTAPGSRFEYSNLGFALAGRLVTRVSGVRLQEYVSRYLLAPLGMTGTRWDGPPEEHRAHGYGHKDSAMPSKGLAKYEDDAFHEEPPLADGSWAPIGGIWTSPRDYSRWVAFQLAATPARDDPDDGPVRRASLREAQDVQRAMPVFANRDEEGRLRAGAPGYGLGWGVSSNCDFEKVVSHSGGLPGYGSYVSLLPRHGVGIFAMTNLTYTTASSVVSLLAKGLRDRGLLPARPIALSPALVRAREDVLSLLASWDDAKAAAIFDTHYASYRAPAEQRAELESLRQRHGACRPGAQAEPEDALRGRLWLSCERGELEVAVELTSDVPARIQALTLESVLPPSAPLSTAAAQVSGLLSRWEESARVLAPDADTKATRRAFASAAVSFGRCAGQRPVRGDGIQSATFRLSCERGELDLSFKLLQGKASDLHLSPVHGGPRCAG